MEAVCLQKLLGSLFQQHPTDMSNSHLDPEEEAPLEVDRDAPFMEKTPLPLRVVVTATRGRFSGITARGGGGTRPW